MKFFKIILLLLYCIKGNAQYTELPKPVLPALPTLQYPTNADTLLYTPAPQVQANMPKKSLENKTINYLIQYDLFGTFTAIQSINSLNSSDINNITAYYNATLNSTIEIKKLQWNFFIYNDAGAKYFFDSITIKNQD